jgi:NodT family efflux transporter outer membrane factor (OMF) lipoprotein
LRTSLRILAFASLLAVGGCATVGPDYHAPSPKLPAAWKAAVPHDGDTATLLAWWQSFDDSVLDTLLAEAEKDNPSLNQATAAILSARATRDQAAAAGRPSATASAAATRAGDRSARTGAGANARSAGLDASWEIDLFGAVRRNTEAAGARIEAREADWHDARVSLAAEVATEYVNYRGCRLLADNERLNLQSLEQTLASTQVAAAQGLVAPADATLAEASAAGAAATLNTQEAECEIGIKALVALTGMEEDALRRLLGHGGEAQPLPDGARLNVTTLPVQLLSQRPDLVAAERTLAAASADIGVAEANRYPRLSLLGSISTTRGAAAVSTPWSFGPSLSLPVFDGGARRAQVAGARAAYQSALARYESAVRTAVKDVEQGLVRLDAANRRSADLASSAANYRKYYDAARVNWQAGSISLLTLEEARRNALQAEQSAIAVRRDRLLYGIALYKALGGGWQAGQTNHVNSTGVSQ